LLTTAFTNAIFNYLLLAVLLFLSTTVNVITAPPLMNSRTIHSITICYITHYKSSFITFDFFLNCNSLLMVLRVVPKKVTIQKACPVGSAVISAFLTGLFLFYG